MRCRIYPGTMGAVKIAIDLFGIDRVDSGSWPGPVYVNAVTIDEIGPARELLENVGLHIEAE